MRVCVWLLVCALLPCLGETPQSETVRGKLKNQDGGAPALETAGHQTIRLEGDQATTGVIRDQRLDGAEIEAKGRFIAPDKFLIDPIHTKAILVHRDGHLKLVTYWCDVCSIRTYTPGPCWCCRRETTLDLRDADEK